MAQPASAQESQGPLALLRRSLERGRLGHAYLFTGTDLDPLEDAARTLARWLICERAVEAAAAGRAPESCGECASCRKIDHATHPDVQWVRPESKSRIITIDQMRDLMHTINLKPTQAPWKVSVIVAADRLNEQAANSFLKTLEEPPGDSVLVLLSTDPQRLLETILSRCLRLNFGGEGAWLRDETFLDWLRGFSQMAAAGSRSLLSRYRLLSVILNRLNEIKASVGQTLKERSHLGDYDDLDPKLREKWEDELAAATEAEYRRQRAQLLAGVQWWLRDVWLATLGVNAALPAFPHLAGDARAVAGRITPRDALGNLEEIERTQRLLFTNVQEALALEVGLLTLRI